MSTTTVADPRQPGRNDTHFGIVGGGMLGLTLARRLSQRGRTVTVIEGADRIGGLASAWKLGDVMWDRHYHVILPSDSHLRGLLSEMDLEREIEWVETRTGCYADGRLFSVSNTVELLRFPVLNLVDKARLAMTALACRQIRDGRSLEKILVSDWLTRWSGRRAFERFWRPLLRSKLGDNYEVTSAAFIWAVIRRLYEARQTGMKKEVFGYVPGGYARILERLHDRLTRDGVVVELGRRVAGIEHRDGQVEIELDDGTTRKFDRVVATVAAPLAARVCRGLSPEEIRRLESVRYQGIVCASALLKRPLAGFYVTNLLDDGLPFTGVIEMSALVDREHFGGRSLVYLPRYLTETDPFMSKPDDEIRESFLQGLERIFADFRREDLVDFRISRVRHVLALSTLNYSDTLPPQRTSVPGLYLVNSAHIVNGTLNVNETIQLADRAMDGVIPCQRPSARPS